MSQRIDNDYRVKLYDRLVEDLKLKPGDLVIFVQNESDKWEIVRADDIAERFKVIGQPDPRLTHTVDTRQARPK